MEVEGAFWPEIDYAMIQKLYELSPEAETRDRLAERIGVAIQTRSYVELGTPVHSVTAF